MTAATLSSRAPLAAARPATRPPRSASLFGRFAAGFWLWVEAFAEARALARAAQARFPFAEW